MTAYAERRSRAGVGAEANSTSFETRKGCLAARDMAIRQPRECPTRVISFRSKCLTTADIISDIGTLNLQGNAADLSVLDVGVSTCSVGN